MIMHSIIILFTWLGSLLLAFWLANSATPDEIDPRDRIKGSKESHFLKG